MSRLQIIEEFTEVKTDRAKGNTKSKRIPDIKWKCIFLKCVKEPFPVTFWKWLMLALNYLKKKNLSLNKSKNLLTEE